nr:CapA family protein [Lachnospiraceae bacterium]
MKNRSFILLNLILCIVLTSCGIEEYIPDDIISAEKTENEAVSQEEEKVIDIPYEEPKEQIAEEETVSEDEPEDSVVTLLFAGDIAFDDHYANMVSLRKRGGIEECISPYIVEEMNKADICMINNEFPYSDRGTPTPNKKFTFRAKPETVEYMKVLGVDIVGLANNHAYDFGPDALLDTFDTLSGAGIPYVGAGHNIDEAAAPYYIEKNGTNIAFVCATQIERSLPPDTKEATATEPGVLRTLDPTRFVQEIEEADANADFVVVFVHWGSENVNETEQAQRELAGAYAKAGADLIIGAHPHVLQGFEYVEGIPVMYSLGNFWFNSKPLDNCVVKAELTNKEISKLQFVPCRQRDCYTKETVKGDGEYERIMDFERSLSNG